eukprot:TRINITY_DN237_c0_g2_i1.p1 TRINITY_DN237_c0_g2~~TRINITY_DN237_c0_g2_i1.p1  ORF type:complete len:170 (+),score=13.68 TRINITY_DN237_c0_g2_i1:28-537(+)
MGHDTPAPPPAKSWEEVYQNVCTQVRSELEGERNWVANLGNVASVVFHQFNRFQPNKVNWVGFYMLHGDTLVLGPFQGKPAVTRINIADGVCGACVRKADVLLVEDVCSFPGHIACDPHSRSELVVPVWNGDKMIAILDIDSPLLNGFTDADATCIKQVCEIAAASCDW